MNKKKEALRLASECSSAVWQLLMKDEVFSVKEFGVGANDIADRILNIVFDKLTDQERNTTEDNLTDKFAMKAAKKWFIKAIEEAQTKQDNGYVLDDADKESWFNDFVAAVKDETEKDMGCCDIAK